MGALVAEKIDQAIGILNELRAAGGPDCWLTFARETTEAGDPVLPLILGQSLTWQSALIITAAGDRIALVGSHETEAVEAAGVWQDVVGYVQSIREPLRETIARLAPKRIAINYSTDDVKADGLTHGMMLLLRDYLGGYDDRFVSAGDVIRRLRSRKTPGEIERICAALATTNEMFRAVAAFAKPGVTERAISEFMHQQARRRHVGLAWDSAACPIVTTGPDSMGGHAIPSTTLAIRPGCVFHLDFGVRQDDYCSDLQRAWYVPDQNEAAPPADVQRAFETVRGAIEAARAALKPGVAGWEVDVAARAVVTEAGYPEYDHATGHHVGRAVHDGGGVLGPRWERYGRTPLFPAESRHVVTLELGVQIDGRGYLGLEEMVLVTDNGADYLSEPQRELWILR